ncbi:MAG: hypothetical protein ACRDLL_07860 [Solirubrobacterales bacterium]
MDQGSRAASVSRRSEALYHLLEDPAAAGPVLLPFGVDPGDIQRVRATLAQLEVRRFSYRDVEELPEGAQAVRERLLASGDPLSETMADEWVFVTTQSLAILLDRTKHSFERFVRGGAERYELTRDQMERGLRAARDRIPPPLSTVMKTYANFPRGRFPKFVVAGGAVALAILVPVAGVPFALEGAVRAGVCVVVGDP